MRIGTHPLELIRQQVNFGARLMKEFWHFFFPFHFHSDLYIFSNYGDNGGVRCMKQFRWEEQGAGGANRKFYHSAVHIDWELENKTIYTSINYLQVAFHESWFVNLMLPCHIASGSIYQHTQINIYILKYCLVSIFQLCIMSRTSIGNVILLLLFVLLFYMTSCQMH